MTQGGIDLDSEQIRALLPHRPPFLLIDRVKDMVPDVSGIGIKNVTLNEPYFQGMPRTRLFVPPTLIIESFAQTAAVSAFYALPKEESGKIGMINSLQKFRMRRAVRPGETLMLHVAKERSFGPSSRMRGTARVDGNLVAEIVFTATWVDAALLGA